MIPYDLTRTKIPAGRRLRRSLLAVVLWAFGISTTIFLIGNWGHSTTGDQATLTASARTALGADVVAERVADWLSDGVAAADEVPVDAVRAAAAEVEATPEARRAVDTLVEEAVAVLLAEPGTESSLDVAETLAPVVPIVEAELAAQGLEVPVGAIENALAVIDPIDLTTDEVQSGASIARQSRALLSWVLVVASAAMILTGSSAVALSEDRLAMVRSLAMRVAVSGFSFIVVFTIAGWALDPERGRSPLLGSGGVLLENNLHTFWAAALPATVVFVVAGIFAWRRARRPQLPPVTRSDDEPTTQELAAV